MWGIKRKRNRRGRKHTLINVKLPVQKARQQRVRLAVKTAGFLLGVVVVFLGVWRGGEWLMQVGFYQNKYTIGATEYFCPADLPTEHANAIRQLALKAFDAVEGRDFGRVDMMLDGGLKPYVLEVNTLPGLTETSLLPMAAAAAGLDFNMLCQRMIELALERN